MKQTEYREGPEALENFKEGMKALFMVPKDAVVQAEKKLKGKKKRASSRGESVLKPHRSDKD